MSLLSSFFGTKPTSTGGGNALDLVTYTAGLASNPDDINPLLDKVRMVSARLKPGQAPSSTDEKELLVVYLQLENYLTTREPLRSFTKEELRKHLNGPLLTQLATYETNQKGSRANP